MKFWSTWVEVDDASEVDDNYDYDNYEDDNDDDNDNEEEEDDDDGDGVVNLAGG